MGREETARTSRPPYAVALAQEGWPASRPGSLEAQRKRAAEAPPFCVGFDGLLARRLARWGRFGLLLGFQVLAGRLVDRLHRQPGLAAVVEAEQLDLDLVAFLDDIGGLLHAIGRELADVDEAIAGAKEIYESTELHHLDHRAVVDLADFRIGGDRLDPLDRSLHRLAIVRGNLHGAVVLDIDLGAGLLDDLADHLAAGADHFAALVGGDLEGVDPRSIFAELGAGRGERLRHLAEDVDASVPGLG